MTENNVQEQLNEINRKLDLVMECAMTQRLRSNAFEDLVADLSIVGKDVYDSSVALLEKHDMEIDPEEFRILAIRLLKNVKNINAAIGAFESTFDLVRDAAPLVKEMIIDFSKKLNELEQKGYFEFIASVGKALDKIVTNTTPEDINKLTNNLIRVMDTIKSMPQHAPDYSIFGLMREMNSPEMKKVFGFMISFIKHFSQKDQMDNHKY
ncbi:MAG: DUF1641 domain-containing protein [Bacteroidales bacterium]|nr:DUF1641 domain-containing protein [Bacteroidales bacterium]